MKGKNLRLNVRSDGSCFKVKFKTQNLKQQKNDRYFILTDAHHTGDAQPTGTADAWRQVYLGNCGVVGVDICDGRV